MGVKVKAVVAGIIRDEATSSERASLPAGDASSEEKGSLMAGGRRQFRVSKE